MQHCMHREKTVEVDIKIYTDQKPIHTASRSTLCIMSTQHHDEEPQPRSRSHSPRPAVNDGNVDEHGVDRDLLDFIRRNIKV